LLSSSSGRGGSDFGFVILVFGHEQSPYIEGRTKS